MFCEDTFTICGDENGTCNGQDICGNFNGNNSYTPSITLINNTCYTCNGYYGPCFEDPVCATCHAFLFPNTAPDVERQSTLDNSSDSEDSGNDEPVDNVPVDNVNLGCVDPYQERKLTPAVTVNSLAKELQRLSKVSHQITDLKIELFPPEVLMHMFQYLDEISLCSIGQVCTRWRQILFMCVKCERWQDFVRARWPALYLRHTVQQDWFELYTALMVSSCCQRCVKQMAASKLPSDWEENPWRHHRLTTEIKAMGNEPTDGIFARALDSQCCHWQASIEGPTGSPYEGGLFILYIQVPRTYPLHPPVVRFITKIFHPNVSRHGDIGLDSIHHNWSLALTLSKLLISIQSLLTDPFCDVCMEPAIGRMYLRNRRAFEEQARIWTIKYAMHDILPH